MINNSTCTSSCDSSSLDYRFLICTQLTTGIALSILSPITIVSNVLLLLTIFKDPLRCFRTPPTCFIVALALVDLTIGVMVEPIFAMYRVASYAKWSPNPGEPYFRLDQIASSFTYVGLNSSFLLVLALILTQFIAITYPHHYRSVVTKRRVLACVGFSLVYFTGFILLQFARIPIVMLERVDLHLHSTVTTILLTVGSAMLFRSYRQYVKASLRLRNVLRVDNQDTSRPSVDRTSERQFTIVTLLLSGIFIIFSLPNIILLHIKLYTKQESLQKRVDFFAAILIADQFMFVKVALDAFIYAWRLTKYRRSLKIVLNCRQSQVASAATDELREMNNFTAKQQNPEALSHHV